MVIKKIALKDLAKELGIAYADIQKAQKQVVGNAILSQLQDIINRSPVDTGLFAQSWDLIDTESSIILGNYSPHAPIVEYGARPFTPPLGPLLAWAKRVLKDPSQPPEYSDHVWALAKYTQRKISEKGMLPHHVLEEALPRIIEEIKRQLMGMQ